MQIQRNTTLWYWAEYSTFSISDEVAKYQLTVDGYSGDAGDAMRKAQLARLDADGKMFSADDSDNDECPICHCGSLGGWWFAWCSASCLNHGVGDSIWTTGATYFDVKASRMLVRVD